jgi:hypothetical protein
MLVQVHHPPVVSGQMVLPATPNSDLGVLQETDYELLDDIGRFLGM